MDKPYYEQMLQSNFKGSPDAEKNWDMRAKHFNMSQHKDRTGFAGKVTSILKDRGVLSGASILDIGGGSGRYAVPLAVSAGHVTMTDISANMLELARENAQQQNLSNLSYVKLDWTDADISALGWEKKFDLVFASMCPAIRSAEGLRKMLASSKGYCLINQFVFSSDSMTDYLMNALGMAHTHDPHNDRATVQAVFNLLWLDGYEPEITYLRHEDKITYTAREAFERYAGRFEQSAKEKGHTLEALIADYAKEDALAVASQSTMAMVLWKA